MPTTRRKTDDVLATARKGLQAQLALVREEIGRLGAEERALTQALSSLNGDSKSSSTAAPAAKVAGERAAKRSASGSSARKGGASRRRRGASKSTADRVKELQGLLADGPKSRNDLAAALKVSPARVQQLLAELGSAVSSQPNPEQRQGKLWTLTGGGGASAAEPTSRHRSGKATGTSTHKPAAGRKRRA